MAENHVARYFEQVGEVARKLDLSRIQAMVDELVQLRERGGRLFILGVGGSAGNATHAVNDFRKLCAIETYAPTDNVSELTARINDEGWEGVFEEWLKISRLRAGDALLIFSVGGGNAAKGLSVNLIKAIDAAKAKGARVLGVVGRDDGHTAKAGDCVVVIPMVDSGAVTPHSEAFQAVVWHCLVSHPALQVVATKWESAAGVTAAR
jgi:D-sedoheptulose 7-phosphate isomerase